MSLTLGPLQSRASDLVFGPRNVRSSWLALQWDDGETPLRAWLFRHNPYPVLEYGLLFYINRTLPTTIITQPCFSSHIRPTLARHVLTSGFLVRVAMIVLLLLTHPLNLYYRLDLSTRLTTRAMAARRHLEHRIKGRFRAPDFVLATQ